MLVGGGNWPEPPPENKEGAAGRFPFVVSVDKQGLVSSLPHGI